MAVYILIKQITNEVEFAEYLFGDGNKELGKLRINKNSGEVNLMESYSVNLEEGIYQRAAHKIKTHWRLGEFPIETCWAS